MASNIIFPELYRFTQQEREYCSLIAKPLILSELKLVFDNSYTIDIPKLIEIEFPTFSEKRIIRSLRDFNNQTYIYFRKLDLDLQPSIILPLFSDCEFQCLKCHKFHKKGSDQCCSLSGGIMIKKAKLNRLTIPNNSNVENKIKEAKEEFIRLHFPDIFDTILL